MTARTTYVPLHSIIVERDGKQVDAYQQYQSTGKAFKFTAEEIDNIAATNNGSIEMSLRNPTDEAADDETPPATEPASSNAPKNGTSKAAKDADL